MKCKRCQREITRGAEERKRVQCHRAGDKEVCFGEGMPAGPLAMAKGPLLWVKHSKCYHIDARLAERQGDVAARRAADPGHIEREERDWRTQNVAEIEELLPDDGVKGPRPAG